MLVRRFSCFGNLLLPFLFALLSACSSDEPLKIGLMAGLSGGNADLGQAGRNGAILAVEMNNLDKTSKTYQAVELLIRDDGNDQGKAIKGAEELLQEHVELIVGPFTTAMSEAVLSVAEKHNVLVFSPTASATSLSGSDDCFFRLNSSTTDNAQHYAEFVVTHQGLRRIVLIVDQQNKTFAEDWASAFIAKARKQGAESLDTVPYDAATAGDFRNLIEQIIAKGPEAVLMVANAVDVARITQQLRKVDTAVKIFAAEWAGTEQLIEMGGKAVDGVVVLHVYDMFGTQAEYQKFMQAYLDRFKIQPSFSSINAFEAINIVLIANRQRREGESIKEAILKYGPYPGLQQEIRFDANGDSHREAYFVRVNGQGFAPAR